MARIDSDITQPPLRREPLARDAADWLQRARRLKGAKGAKVTHEEVLTALDAEGRQKAIQIMEGGWADC